MFTKCSRGDIWFINIKNKKPVICLPAGQVPCTRKCFVFIQRKAQDREIIIFKD